jgi:predicted ATP-grasp superfamily ATP-dependent carboligase
MYTGALENRPSLVGQLARRRPLWGSDAPVLAVVRAPWTVQALLRAANVCCPRVWRCATDVPRGVRCLVKPVASAGGNWIRFWTGNGLPPSRSCYFQEFIEGDPCAAVFLADRHGVQLLGITRQLIGESWLHAAPFHYCGSIGPVIPPDSVRGILERMGSVLAGGSGMHGLFGVDFVMRQDLPWLVEVNPRYTASMEVVEFARGVPLLALHRGVFDRHAPAIPAMSLAPIAWIGKAILFARDQLVFPDSGPWKSSLDRRRRLDELPAFADIPMPGQRIARGWPILTFFARATTMSACLDTLRQTAADLDRWLFAR